MRGKCALAQGGESGVNAAFGGLMFHIFDSLERRLLLSVTFGSGVVRVIGTGGKDTIEFQLRADDEQIRVEVNGSVRRFPVAAVRRINVDAQAGNDVVEFSDRDGGLF